MRTFNVKLAVVLLVVVIAVVGSTHLLHSYQLQRKSTWFKNQAETAWTATPRRFADAIASMKVYLRLEPRLRSEGGNGYVVSRLAPAHPASTTLEELVRALEKQDPPDVAGIQRVRRKLIRAEMDPGTMRGCHLPPGDSPKELPSNVDVLDSLGKCQIMLMRETEAIANFSEAIGQRPDRMDIYYTRPWPCVILCRIGRRPKSAWPR